MRLRLAHRADDPALCGPSEARLLHGAYVILSGWLAKLKLPQGADKKAARSHFIAPGGRHPIAFALNLFVLESRKLL
jgi:hypothetical protein